MKTAADWSTSFPALQGLAPELARLLGDRSSIVSLPVGSRIFGPGHAPENFLLLLKGSVRVQQVSESGREIVLYRVTAGESCALTTACLMAHEDYPAEAIAETDIEAIAVPRAVFDEAVARSPEFRRFVFTTFSTRVMNLLKVIEDIAFARMDIRMAQKLLALAGPDGRVAATQQQLAAELGTAREVVSRTLAELQRRGWISSGRGSITLLDRAGLERLARSG